MFAALPAFTSAEFYRYVDEQGNVHYTDDLSDIPAKERPKADKYDTLEAPQSPAEPSDAKRPTEGHAQAPVVKEGEDNAAKPGLRERGAALDAEYELLRREREQLEKAASEASTPSTQAEIAERIKDYNKRMKDYEQRRLPFNEEVEAYNAALKKATRAPERENE
jgi:hypothetical protein